ncbi:MAG: UbiA-like protein EboC [Cyanobacteria bacterium J06600_6]
MTTTLVQSDKTLSLRAYLQLMRPANIVTAWADILLGAAATGVSVAANFGFGNFDLSNLAWLIIATTGLYGGGVVFNDVCDAELDAKERPERPIPSSRVSLEHAAALGTALLMMGILAAGMVSTQSEIMAMAIAASVLIYDKWGKHQTLLGPLNMGICRGGNLLLGVSLVSGGISDRWYLALIPIVYIAAITAISQGEVHGGNKTTGIMAIALIMTVIGGIFGLGMLPEYELSIVLPFAGLFSALVLPPFIKAALEPTPELIQNAVKTGILALIVLNAAIAAGFAGWVYGLLVLALLPLSRGLGKMFAIT